MNKKLLTMRLADIVPYENNPRHNDNAVDAVKESIRQCEYIAPIVVDENNVILAGHTRAKALEALGKDEVDVMQVTGLTDEQKRKYRLLDNKTNEVATWDFNALALEIADLDFEGFDFGFEELVSDDDYGTDFELPDGDKPEICTMTFTLHEEQKGLIDYALSITRDEVTETFGNTNKNGNALYEVVRQWAEQRK